MATVSIGIPPECASFLSTNIPELLQTNGTNFPVVGLAFGAVNEAAFYRFTAWNYGASNPNVSLLVDWYPRTAAVSGNVSWGGSLSVITPFDAQSILTDAFATEATTNGSVSGTSNGVVRTTVTITSLDSLAAGDTVELRVRCTTYALSAGDAVIVGLTVQYPDV